jgi:ferredoxin like protein
MSEQKMPSNLADKLFLLKFKHDDRSHIHIVSNDVCLRCVDKPCTTICPADVYQWTGDHIAVSYENCIECGACRLICPYHNIACVMPRGGFGVQYRYG